MSGASTKTRAFSLAIVYSLSRSCGKREALLLSANLRPRGRRVTDVRKFGGERRNTYKVIVREKHCREQAKVSGRRDDQNLIEMPP
jgi:hypothetical protein